ncbi:calcium ion binding [Desmophyllum pertusum]|uniref:Calcium ion binding n=1 Tax=Desmophyllum pertusum TaxID=174260 RepID=A0A9W9YVH8_9CNID|nr:calcium ion binding [Desmophyllum pertusum]
MVQLVRPSTKMTITSARALHHILGKHCEIGPGIDCQDIKKRGHSRGDGMYWLDPDAGSHSNAFLAYCDMTSYNGGWTMCYTTDEYVKLSTEVAFNAQFPYGSDGYRTNCNIIPFTEIIFVDHQTGNQAYFKRQTNQSITAAENYGNAAGTYGLWDGLGTNNAYSYQLLICDDSFYSGSGFFVSGYTNCYKVCNFWCGDYASPYFRTASTNARFKGVAFNTNGHPSVGNRRISVGLR